MGSVGGTIMEAGLEGGVEEVTPLGTVVMGGSLGWSQACDRDSWSLVECSMACSQRLTQLGGGSADER